MVPRSRPPGSLIIPFRVWFWRHASQNHEWTVKAEPIRLTLRTASNLLGRKQSYQGDAAYDGKQRAINKHRRMADMVP
jgi:hypothetical protein